MTTPQKIGPYILLEALGEGGMGSVYCAKHEDTGTIVALKTVRLPKQTLLNNLRREIHAMSRIEHPGIVRIVDQGMDDAQPWYAMELVEGMTLRQYVFGEQLPAARASTAPPPQTTQGPTTEEQAPGSPGQEQTTQGQVALKGPAALLSTAILQLLGEAPEEQAPRPSARPGDQDAFLPAGDASKVEAHETGRWWSHALATSARLNALPSMSLPESLGIAKASPAPSVDAFGVALPSRGEREDEAESMPSIEGDDAKTMFEPSPFAALADADEDTPTEDHPELPEDDQRPTTSTRGLSGLPDSPDTMLEMSPFARTIAPTQLEKVLQLVLRLCEPLAYLHGEGIVHCDLKPDNILIREDGSPVLIDFGLLATFAGSFNREVADLTLAGLGTIPYMAPEQINGRLVDARTDIYALGCILYELLVGEPPFTGNWTELLGHHLFTEPTAPSTWLSGIPERLDQLVLEMLAKEPRERTGHVDVVRNSLLRMLGGGTSSEGPAPGAGPVPQMYLFRPELSGRERELELLKSHVKQARKGGHGLVMVSGESGVGKTRLTLELGLHARAVGMHVLAGECTGQESAPLEVFQAFFLAVQDRIQELGESAEARLLGEHGRWLFPYARALRAYASDEPTEEGEEAEALPPSEKRMQVFRALGHTLREFAQNEPLLLLLDDLHHADSLTLEALTHLARMRDLERVLIVGTFRSEEARVGLHLLCSHEAVIRLELQRLDQAAVGAMIRDMLAQPAISEGFVSYLAEQSEGNPFFIAEYLRAAVEEGLVWRDEQGRWQVSPMYEDVDDEDPGSQILLPSSLQKLVKRRLQGLSPKATALLELASVLGREISFHLIKQAMGLSSESMWNLIEALRRREVLEYQFDGTLYFVHDKIREIVYSGLESEQRVALHRQAALAYETIFRNELSQHAAQIGWHWAHAGALIKAQRYYKRGAKVARGRGANDEAVRLLEAYLELDTPPQRERIEVLLALGQLRQRQHRFEEAREQLVLARAMAQSLVFSRLEAKALLLIGHLDWSRGRLQSAHQQYEAAIDLLRSEEDGEDAGWAVFQLIQLKLQTKQHGEARRLVEEEIARCKQQGSRDLVGALIGCLAQVLREDGAFELSEKTFQEALLLQRAAGNRVMEARYLLQYLILKRWMGEPPHTLEVGHARADELLQMASQAPTSGPAYTDDPHFLLFALLLCERGHLALLTNQSAEHRLHQARHIVRRAGLPLSEGTPTGDAIAALQRAQEAFQTKSLLLFGQHPDDLPPSLLPLSVPKL